MSEDVIYREDAIKAYNEAMDELVKWQMEEWQLGDFSECEFNTTDCKHIARKIEAIPSADRPREWIPCSERLPKEKDAGILKKLGTEKRSEYVLATVEVKGERMTVTACTYDGVWQWDKKYAFPDFKVVAWMPLPKPWKGADDD